MESRATLLAQPPYKWMIAHPYTSKEYRSFKKESVRVIQEVLPTYGDNDVRLIQIVNLNHDIIVHMGIFKDMAWGMFKQHLGTILERYEDKLPFDVKKVEDVAITHIPVEIASAIDDSKHDLFTVVPDNAIVFFNQVKVDGTWRHF